MHFYCLGLNHRTAPLALREKLSLGENEIQTALMRWASDYCPSELVLLSTCNRIELYTASEYLAISQLEEFLSDVCGVPVHRFAPHLYRFNNLDAARHLFGVAAGLDSQVIGEPQILGQVVRALELARQGKTAGPVLHRLFQTAIHAGKRARTETGISRDPVSVSSLAASLAEQIIQPFDQAQILILGAGEMAELAVQALRKRGASRILMINRTAERAREVANRWGAQMEPFENLEDVLPSADVLISATSAAQIILTAEMIKKAMARRAERPMLLIDIALPRNIDPEAAHLPLVRYFDLDSLNARVEHSLAGRRAEIPRVKLILDEEIRKFADFMEEWKILPVIADIRQQAENIRRELVEKTLRHLPDLTEEERNRIEAMTQAMVKRILHQPTRYLRSEASSPQAMEVAAFARVLFGLEPKSSGNLSVERQYPF